MSPVETPVQTNAADEAQVELAQERMSDAERQAYADSRADIADYDSRRRAWPVVLAVLGDCMPSEASDAAIREHVAEQRLHKRRVAAWVTHRREFVQMVDEGLKRLDDDDKTRKALNRRRTE